MRSMYVNMGRLFQSVSRFVLDIELVLLLHCLKFGKTILAQEPLQLAGEIIGQLRGIRGTQIIKPWIILACTTIVIYTSLPTNNLPGQGYKFNMG